MATQIFQNSFLTRTEILKPIQKMAGEQLKWPAGSQFVVAGKFYQQTTDLTINLTSLAANTLYMVYAVLSGGVITGLTYSTNVNSVGPVGASGWKLIGAFYADGSASPVFGSLVNIQGSPISNWMNCVVTFTGSAGPTLISSNCRRIGDSHEFQVDYQFTSSATVNETNIVIPASIPFDGSKEPNNSVRTACGDGLYRNTGTGAIQSGTVHYATNVTGNNIVTFFMASIAVASGHSVGVNFRVPTLASATPLVDL